MTTILVPIDFSTCSENALAFAIQLADKIKATILLLNVPYLDGSNIESPISATLVVEEKARQAKKNIIKSIQKATETVRSSLDASPSIQPHIEMGKAESTICDVAKRNQVDYIVMGTQGENSTVDKYLGSVASNVLKNAPCPVIIMPGSTFFSKEVSIGYATDFSDSDPFEIWRVLKFFKPFQPKISCIHVNDKQVNNTAKIKDLKDFFTETIPKLSIEFHSLFAKNKVKGMNSFIEKHNINLLVMYKPKRTFIESIFHTSYTQKMASQATIPLLVLKEK